ncbi:MAG: DUF47 domain-containing protein [Chloroflexota bacterium]|nr:DUF47 domain-containing protein [Chloroflexota bacterium]MDE3194176.1 DUF47 domain-containing protein [Chloroflexota bacterium]
MADVQRFQILPVEQRFFDLFEKHARTLRQAAERLLALVEDFTDVEGKVAQLAEIEHEADFVTHEIIDLARRSFTTPFETEDITALAARVDDAVDAIEATGGDLVLWKVERPTPQTIDLCRIITRAAVEIDTAIPILRDKRSYGKIREHIVEVNRYENDADRVARQALRDLIAHRDDWFEVTRWKEIYDNLEDCADRMEDIADQLEGITVKHG